ncbi:MAG: restriction endonuclease subunit S [Nitrospira sp.]|nr:restriction endonuclease subunit S [Nitrospira sp.]
MNFRLSSGTDKNKVFIVRRSELEGRLDPFFYRTDLREIDTLVRGKAERFLGDFALTMDGGATPLKAGGDEYYADESVGIPLLRVQNITEEGINFDNLVFINQQTHENYLSRSRVFGGDLLVTITGRIASSAVAPEGFEGNINQHSVVIRTRNKRISDYLAVFLNSKIGQKLAIKRTTGGTRPALDYKALIKIPVIEGLPVVEIMRKAYLAKKEKEEQAKKLLDGIDDYLLGELGIELPEVEEGTLESRIFTRRLSEVSGGRLDAPVHQNKYVLETAKYPMNRFGDCVFINPLVSFSGFSPDTQATFIPMEKISDEYGEADISEFRTLTESGGYTKFQDNDLLWAKITPCMQNGKSAIVSGLRNSIGFGSTEFHIFRAKSGTDIGYIYGLLRLHSLRNHAVLYFSGSAGHQRVSDEFFKKLNIPKPPLEKQTEIANHITEIRNQAKRLREQAKADLEQAKQEVETMILEW